MIVIVLGLSYKNPDNKCSESKQKKAVFYGLL